MNEWGDSVRSTNHALSIAVGELSVLIPWVQENFVASDAVSEQEAEQVAESFDTLKRAVLQLAHSVGGIADAQSSAVLKLIGGRRLSVDEYHILMASGSMYWTNKSMGLSEFEDYDVYCMMHFESEDRTGYILFSDESEIPDESDSDDDGSDIVSSLFRSRLTPPEEIQWNTLTSEQQTFFEKHFPDEVGRFVRDE